MRHKERSRTCPKKVIMLSSSTPSSSPSYPRQQVIPSACSVPFSSLLLVQVTSSVTKQLIYKYISSFLSGADGGFSNSYVRKIGQH